MLENKAFYAMKYHQMCSLLKRSGWQFYRRCRGSHELWRHPGSGETLLVTRSGLCDRARQNWLNRLRKKSEVAA
jgi:predicted RNA binding protein YcfA (HicA-like mRNA interferase family)